VHHHHIDNVSPVVEASSLIPQWAIWLAVVLQLINWVSTVAILPLIERLIFTNWWLRKVPQIINAFLFLWLMSLLPRRSVRGGAEA
jgi:hypothetical protein